MFGWRVNTYFLFKSSPTSMEGEPYERDQTAHLASGGRVKDLEFVSEKNRESTDCRTTHWETSIDLRIKSYIEALDQNPQLYFYCPIFLIYDMCYFTYDWYVKFMNIHSEEWILWMRIFVWNTQHQMPLPSLCRLSFFQSLSLWLR